MFYSKTDTLVWLLSGYDCGVYVICIAEELCQNFLDNGEKCVGESILAKDVNQKRMVIKSLVRELGRKKTWCERVFMNNLTPSYKSTMHLF